MCAQIRDANDLPLAGLLGPGQPGSYFSYHGQRFGRELDPLKLGALAGAPLTQDGAPRPAAVEGAVPRPRRDREDVVHRTVERQRLRAEGLRADEGVKRV